VVTFAPAPRQLAASEIEVRYALHRVGADLGEQIDIKPTAAHVEVSGVFSSAEHKKQVAEALAGIPHTVTSLRVVEERPRRTLPKQRFAWSKVTHPPKAPLSQVLKQRFPRLEDREAFVVDVLDRAQAAYDHVWALRRLAERYDSSHVLLLNWRQNQLLDSLIQEHSGALRASLSSLRSDLQPLLPIPWPAEGAAATDVTAADWCQQVFNAFDAVQQIYQSTIALLTSSDPVEKDLDSLEKNLLRAFLRSGSSLRTLGLNQHATDVAGAFTP
jgi:hypothetical protein